MTNSRQFGELRVVLSAGAEAPEARLAAEGPFHLLVMGDFTGAGRERSDRKPLGERQILQVDRDDLDSVMERLGVALQLPELEDTRIGFLEIDDFHPDRLLADLGLFARLRGLRRRLGDPASFATAAAELTAGQDRDAAGSAAEQTEPVAGVPMPDDLLSAALDATTASGRRSGGAAESGEALADRLIARIVAPFVVPRPDPRQEELVAAVDQALGATLRRLLHDPRFQALESAWRGLELLVRRLETGSRLKLFLLDASRAEWAADLTASDALEACGLHKRLVEATVATPGSVPWALMIGLYDFAAEPGDAALLGRMAKIAAAAGAPFLAAARPSLVGCRSFGGSADPDLWTEPAGPGFEEAWRQLRALPEAAWLALVQPRLLLRMPYGRRGGQVALPGFEELAEPADHEAFLWGNGAIAVGCLIAQAFSRAGWRLRPGEVDSLDRLPFHVREIDGEQAVQPCAELLLSERGAQVMAERGLTPLWSQRDRDSVTIGGVRALAAGSPELRGRWRR